MNRCCAQRAQQPLLSSGKPNERSQPQPFANGCFVAKLLILLLFFLEIADTMGRLLNLSQKEIRHHEKSTDPDFRDWN
jgi:hypothetical protein